MNHNRLEELPIPTMGTGRWYALLNSKGREVNRIFVDDAAVCSELDMRHANDDTYEGAWDASKEEYKKVYAEISAEMAAEL